MRHSEELITPQYWELIKEGKGNNLVRDSLWHFFRAFELQQLAESCGLTTHISDETERIQATSELVRVAKPGAIVCIRFAI